MSRIHELTVLAVVTMMGAGQITEAAPTFISDHWSINNSVTVGHGSGMGTDEGSFGVGSFVSFVMSEVHWSEGDPFDPAICTGDADGLSDLISEISEYVISTQGSVDGAGWAYASCGCLGGSGSIQRTIEFSVDVSMDYTISGFLRTGEPGNSIIVSLDRIGGLNQNLFYAQALSVSLDPVTVDLADINPVEGTLNPGNYRFYVSAMSDPELFGALNYNPASFPSLRFDVTLVIPEPGTVVLLLAIAPLIGLRRWV